MPSNKRSIIRRALNDFRQRLAHADALPQLAVLGVISGLVTGSVAVIFRLAVDLPLDVALPHGGSENFESLPPLIRFLLPLCGALLLGLLWSNIRPRFRQTGVTHVIERVHKHQGRLPFANGITQFFGGALALISGQSLGREGPAVQLGATFASQLGQLIQLPHNSLRTLVGCGVAAAIAASFNTPLAGVIFAMEVVLMEYTISGFIPVILASVSGTILTRAVFGSEPAFAIPALEIATLWELPFIAFSGLIIGLCATALLKLYTLLRKLEGKPPWLKFTIAGAITGVVGIFVPQVLGVGYDTVEAAMLGELSLFLLLIIIVGKIVTFCFSSALGIPAGSIGPSLVIGACLGGALGIIGDMLYPGTSANTGLYAMMGMGAMMGAVLNAPLAALIAILELTYNPNLLMPSMLLVVIATVCTRLFSHQPGIFQIGLESEKFSSPVFQALSRAGVTSLMDQNFASHSRHLPWHQAKASLANKPKWLVVEDPGEPAILVRASNLANFLETSETALWDEHHEIDLLDLPGNQNLLSPIHARATLQEALIRMDEQKTDTLYIAKTSTPLGSQTAGIITRDMIDAYYQ